jgi:hypothetical protein
MRRSALLKNSVRNDLAVGKMLGQFESSIGVKHVRVQPLDESHRVGEKLFFDVTFPGQDGS